MGLANGVFPSGLPFCNDLKKNLEEIADRVFNKNKAALIIIDGGVGEGKTTLAVHVADFFEGRPIVFNNSYGMGGAQFQEKLIESYHRKNKAIIYDEAGDFAKHSAISSFNQQINRVFETYRAFKVVVILVLPNMNVLDNRIYDLQIPRLLLHVGRRKKTGCYSGYSLRQMFYLKDLMGRLKCKPQAYQFQIPNFRGLFYDLPPDRAEEINKISIEGKLDIVSTGALHAKGLLNRKELIKKTGRSSTWLNNRLVDLNIKPATIYRNRAFYDAAALYKLEDYIRRKEIEGRAKN